MALFIRQDEERSELQKRLAAELQEKTRKSVEKNNQIDGVEDSSYIENLKKPAKYSALILLLVVGLASLIIWLTIVNSSR